MFPRAALPSRISGSGTALIRLTPFTERDSASDHETQVELCDVISRNKESVLLFTPFHSTLPGMTRTQPLKRTPLRRVSKKNWWEKLRPKLKKEFERAGITTCEVGYQGCWRDNGLGFAHSLKRRNIKTEDERREVVLACNCCHDKLEILPEHEMKRIVKVIIFCRTSPMEISM